MTEMSELEKVLSGLVDDAETRKLVAETASGHLAYRLRAELVCCDIFERVRRDGGDENAIGRAVLRGDWHSMCYWGEAAARLTEEEGKA